MKESLITVIIFSILLFFSPNTLAEQQPSQALPKKASQFIEHMTKKYHFDRNKLTQLLKQAKYDKDVMKRITHPYEKQPWYVYRQHFVTKERIMQGVHYWKNHLKVLRYAKQHYNIPPSIIVAVLGIETNYGKQKGTYSALNALNTLAFYHKTRGKFFQKELTHLLLLTREQELPILLVKSSYAGALGIPQFMPSTYRNYAVKYPSNKHIDLISNDSDAIVSVANYFRTHGWRQNQPIAIEFKSKRAVSPKLISKRARPKRTIAQLKRVGIQPFSPISEKQKAAIVELTNEAGKEYWMTFHNFRVIMRYNPSIIYAMAVYQLSQTIQQAYAQQTKS